MQSRLGKKEGDKVQMSSKELLAPFSCIFLSLAIPLIKYKVTLEMLTPKVKKTQPEIYIIASK